MAASNTAIGIVEAKSFCAIYDCLDLMLKTADIETTALITAGGGLVTAVIEGRLDHVKEALEFGADAVGAADGLVVSTALIPSPTAGTRDLMRALMEK